MACITPTPSTAAYAAPTLLRRSLVQNRVQLSRSSIYLRMAQGTFPKPIRLGPNSVAWLASDIDSWICERAAESGKFIGVAA